MSVVIVDHGLCNIDSVVRAVEHCGATGVVVARNAGDLRHATRLVLPGVGAFPAAMDALAANDVRDALDDAVTGRGIPVLGLCLGMQLMCASSTENGQTAGLGWVSAVVERLSAREGERVPHVGWNEVHFERGD